jgi:hypothetical protein
MGKIKFSKLVYPSLGLLLTCCAAVDQFGARIYDGNLNSQNAMNQEMLLNVVRASNFQAMNFIAVTQVTGGQTETLTTGLPTVTIGPLQTAAQHQFQVSNSVSSAATGSYQSNPLVSTVFQDAMLSPISPRKLGLLLGSHPREPVFYSTIEAIVFRVKNADSVKLYRLVNDPTRNQLGAEACAEKFAALRGASPLDLAADCNYAVFVNFLGVLIQSGLTTELVPAPPTKPPVGDAKGGGSPTVQEAPGHLCFDPTRALPDFQSAAPVCVSNTLAAAVKTAKDTPLSLSIAKVGDVEAGLVLRSPIGVFNYYGKLLRDKDKSGQRISYLTREAQGLLRGDEPFFNVTGDNLGCFVGVTYSGRFYCVPEGSPNTAMLLDIIIQLRNLSISPSDLNSAFTVRLTN